MKIQSVEPLELGETLAPKAGGSIGSPWSSTIVLVKVTTSNGAVGWGEAPTTLMTLPVYESVREVARFYEGRELHDLQKNFFEYYRYAFYQPVSMEETAALSAVDIACYDLLGKELGAPIYDLLGGRVRDRVRAYANGWYSDCIAPSEFAAKAKQMVAKGFTGLKFDPFADQYDGLTREGLVAASARVGAIRDAVGPKVDLLIEHHGRFRVPEAIRAGQELAQYDPLFNEEPVHPELMHRLGEYRAKVPTPVALGERLLTPAAFAQAISQGWVDTIQPDITNSGGFTSGRKIAAVAEAFGANVAYHNAFGPIQTAATLHMDAWMPNFLIQESFEANWPDWKIHLASGYTLEDGHFTLPQKPGLGIEVNEKVVEAQKVSGMEPITEEPPWVIGHTWVRPPPKAGASDPKSQGRR
jgi:gluconate/galactonate dehydratase